MPKVSVICRTYNQRDWIGQAIQSALSQSYPDFELLVIDDASTDGTSDEIKKFSDKRIRFVKNIKNIGHLSSLNLGIAESCGEYISILDGDDEYLPSKLEKQVRLLDGNPDYGAVFSYINTIGDKANPNVARNCKFFEGLINNPGGTKARMFRQCFGTGTFLAFPSEMFRKKFAFYWPQHVLGLCETNFHLSMLLSTNIKVLEEPLINYRVAENYDNKWTSPASLESELYFILDRFLEIKDSDLFKEIFENDLGGIDIPFEQALLPYILTKIAEKDPSKRQWANYNFHRFLAVPENHLLLKNSLSMDHKEIMIEKRGPPPRKQDVIRLKKYKRICNALLFLSISLFVSLVIVLCNS